MSVIPRLFVCAVAGLSLVACSSSSDDPQAPTPPPQTGPSHSISSCAVTLYCDEPAQVSIDGVLQDDAYTTSLTQDFSFDDSVQSREVELVFSDGAGNQNTQHLSLALDSN